MTLTELVSNIYIYILIGKNYQALEAKTFKKKPEAMTEGKFLRIFIRALKSKKSSGNYRY